MIQRLWGAKGLTMFVTREKQSYNGILEVSPSVYGIYGKEYQPTAPTIKKGRHHFRSRTPFFVKSPASPKKKKKRVPTTVVSGKCTAKTSQGKTTRWPTDTCCTSAPTATALRTSRLHLPTGQDVTTGRCLPFSPPAHAKAYRKKGVFYRRISVSDIYLGFRAKIDDRSSSLPTSLFILFVIITTIMIIIISPYHCLWPSTSSL